MPNFVKLYGTILDSTIWLEPLPTKVVWITMLAMADATGCVRSSIPNLAKRAGVSRQECEDALVTLSAPDPDSKTPDYEGRRIERIDGGWFILNHRKYRDMRTDAQIATAERVKNWRHNKGVTVTEVTDVTPRNKKKRDVRTDTYTEEERDTDKTTTKAKPLSAVRKTPNWVSEGLDWWVANVGTIAPGRFGSALAESVKQHEWPRVFEALKCYVVDAKSRGKPARPEWCAAEIVRWIEWAHMPATDENGDLTPRGKAIVGGQV